MNKLLAMLLCIAAAGCHGAAPPPLYLGHVATLSGPGAEAGEHAAWGIRLAVEQLAHDHFAILGRPVHVKHTDARGQLDAFQGEAVRLVTLSKALALYGGDTTDEVLRLDRVAAPLLTPLGYKPRGGSNFVFGIGISPAQEGHALARFAVEEKNVRQAALFVDERLEECRALAEAFEEEFVKVAAEKLPKGQAAKPSATNFGKDARFADLTKGIDGAKTQAVLFAGSAGDFLEFHKALPAAKVLIFFGGGDLSRPPFTKGGDLVFLASAFAVDKELPKTEDFARKFRAAFKEDPDVHAALAYDAIRLLAEAMSRAQVPAGDRDRFLEELRQTKDVAGLTGPVSFGKDQILRRPIYVGILEGKSFIPLKRYHPPPLAMEPQ